MPEVQGLEGAPLDRRRCDDFDLVVSEHAAEVEPSEEAVLAHARVVEALMPHADALLPARFGLAFADSAALEEALREKAATLEESLERVRGRVELGVRVVGEQSAPREVENGREYLRPVAGSSLQPTSSTIRSPRGHVHPPGGTRPAASSSAAHISSTRGPSPRSGRRSASSSRSIRACPSR